MGTTVNYSLPYPADGTPRNTGKAIRSLATAVDTALNTVEESIVPGGGASEQKVLSSKTGAYALTAGDHVIVATSGTWNATLPTAASIAGREYIIKNSGTGIVTVVTTSSQTIDGELTFALAQYESITVISNGTNWVII